jgi:hypothetical protein
MVAVEGEKATGPSDVMQTIETPGQDEDEDVKMEGTDEATVPGTGEATTVTEEEWDAMHTVLNAIYDYRTKEYSPSSLPMNHASSC